MYIFILCGILIGLMILPLALVAILLGFSSPTRIHRCYKKRMDGVLATKEVKSTTVTDDRSWIEHLVNHFIRNNLPSIEKRIFGALNELVDHTIWDDSVVRVSLLGLEIEAGDPSVKCKVHSSSDLRSNQVDTTFEGCLNSPGSKIVSRLLIQVTFGSIIRSRIPIVVSLDDLDLLFKIVVSSDEEKIDVFLEKNSFSTSSKLCVMLGDNKQLRVPINLATILPQLLNNLLNQIDPSLLHTSVYFTELRGQILSSLKMPPESPSDNT